MTDRFSPDKRRQIMSRVKGRDTQPERLVRSALHRMGYRFRLHRQDLPGKPDIVLPRHKKVILVHGCFWHGHQGCARAARPATNRDFWDAKIDETIRRDSRNVHALQQAGWSVLVIWQCQTRDKTVLRATLASFLESQ